MIDENAFGLCVAYHTIENDEYALERDEFVARLDAFREIVMAWMKAERLGDGVLAVDLGHAIYCEVGEGDEAADPFAWLRGLRGRLEDAEFANVAVLVHGGRWVAEAGSDVDLPGVAVVGDQVVARVAHSSEPLRKALYVEAATQDDDERSGWGPGFYVDADAIEALGKKLKNAPTPLTTAGGTYYRFGR
jgi:hypothetical protein